MSKHLLIYLPRQLAYRKILTEIALRKNVSILGATFRKPSYLALTAVLTAFFSYALYFLSLRSAGENTTIFTTTQSSVGFELKQFGFGYVIGTLSLDLISGLLISMMIVLAVSSRRLARTGGACSTASVLIGVATAGCPSCAVPLAGTFGLVFFAGSLPLLGLEFQLLSVAVLLVGLIWLVRRSRRVMVSAS